MHHPLTSRPVFKPVSSFTNGERGSGPVKTPRSAPAGIGGYATGCHPELSLANTRLESRGSWLPFGAEPTWKSRMWPHLAAAPGRPGQETKGYEV